MADKGTFRTGIGGFNKKDVFDYIDAMQVLHAEELEQAQNACEQERARVEEVEKKLEEEINGRQEDRAARAAVEEENRSLLDRLEQLKNEQAEYQRRVAETEDIRMENRRLTEKLEFQEKQAQANLEDRLRALTEELEASRKELEENRRQSEKWKAAIRRYENLIGDVGGFIMEIRAMGQRFLETSYLRSLNGLDAMDNAITVLEGQITENRSGIEKIRQELQESKTTAGLRMEELAQELEKAAEQVDEEKIEGDDLLDETSFFR